MVPDLLSAFVIYQLEIIKGMAFPPIYTIMVVKHLDMNPDGHVNTMQ